MTPQRLILLAALIGILPVRASAQTDDLAIGKFLVASRELGDPNFAETVVLLVHYDEEDGAVGLIVNRRTDVPLSRVFPEQAKGRTDPVYMGGPVQPASALALLKSADKPKDANRVIAGVYLISGKALLEKTLVAKADPDAFHVYLGYAGWGRGQLEHEVGLGAWHILPADAATVFHSDPDSVWPRLIRQTELRIALAANHREQGLGRCVVAEGLADVLVNIDVARREDEASAQLERIGAQAMLPMPARLGALASLGIVGANQVQ